MMKQENQTLSQDNSKAGVNKIGSDHTDVVEDGLEDIENEVTRLRWPKDQRLSDVRKMLQSARPVIIGDCLKTVYFF